MNKALNFTPYRLLEDNNVNDVDDNVMGYWIQRSQEIGLRELTCVESHTKKSWMKCDACWLGSSSLAILNVRSTVKT